MFFFAVFAVSKIHRTSLRPACSWHSTVLQKFAQCRKSPLHWNAVQSTECLYFTLPDHDSIKLGHLLQYVAYSTCPDFVESWWWTDILTHRKTCCPIPSSFSGTYRTKCLAKSTPARILSLNTSLSYARTRTMSVTAMAQTWLHGCAMLCLMFCKCGFSSNVFYCGHLSICNFRPTFSKPFSPIVVHFVVHL